MWKSPGIMPVDKQVWVQCVHTKRVCVVCKDPHDGFCYDENNAVVEPVAWQSFFEAFRDCPPSPMLDSEDCYEVPKNSIT